MGLHRKNTRLTQLLLLLPAVIFALAFLLPTVLTVVNSFMKQLELFENYGVLYGVERAAAGSVNLKLIPDEVSVSQYATVLLKSPDYLFRFWNSVILVVPIVFFQLVVALLAAYAFTHWRGRLRELLFFAYIVLMLMPYQVTLVPNYLMSERLGLLNTRWAIWLPAIVSPFSVFLLTKYMRRIPASYNEAAQLDGAGRWQVFLYIYVPLCKSILYSVAILLFIDYWNMVEQPLLLLKDAMKQPLSVYLAAVNARELGIAFAAATIYMIPCGLLFLYGEEYLVQGITYSGGIKA